jgi:hypothetical protein
LAVVVVVVEIEVVEVVVVVVVVVVVNSKKCDECPGEEVITTRGVKQEKLIIWHATIQERGRHAPDRSEEIDTVENNTKQAKNNGVHDKRSVVTFCQFCFFIYARDDKRPTKTWMPPVGVSKEIPTRVSMIIIAFSCCLRCVIGCML